MSSDAAIVFGILGVAGVLFASGRVRLDVTALLVALALPLLVLTWVNTMLVTPVFFPF